MKRLVITFALAAVLAVVLAAPAGASAAVWQPSTVATMTAGDYGAFLEGMAADSHGNLFGSLTTWGYYDETVDPSLWGSNSGEVWRVPRNGKTRLVATLDLSPNGMLMGVAADGRDRIYVVTYDFGDPQTVGCGVYRVGPGGSMVKVIALPAGSWPNGLAIHDSRAYITESASGAVWRARLSGGVTEPATPWLQDALLAPGDPAVDETASGIGANGIAFRGDRLYVGVADYGRIVSVPVRADGSAGKPKVLCERPQLVSADGIAFDALGRLWVAANAGTTGSSPSGALYCLSTSGAVRQHVDDPGWLNYPVMPVFGTTRSTSHTLFIANGAYYGYADGSAPDIQALHVDARGLQLR